VTDRFAIFLAAALVSACEAEIPGETRLPRCEPRSSTEPGRLNIETGAEDYGVMAPCRASLRLYIPARTPLGSLKADVELLDRNGKGVARRTMTAAFPGPQAGMLVASINLPVVPDVACHGLDARVESLACFGAAGERIDCPAVRVRTSYVLHDVTVEPGGLDVCYD